MPDRKRIGNPGQTATRQGRLDEWRRAIEQSVKANRAAADAEWPRDPRAPIPKRKPAFPADSPDSILVQKPRRGPTATAKPKRSR